MEVSEMEVFKLEMLISACTQASNKFPTAKLMWLAYSYLTELVAKKFDQTGSGQSKVMDAKSELLITWLMDELKN